MTSTQFRNIRLKLNLSQTQLGDFIGLSKRQIINIEGGDEVRRPIALLMTLISKVDIKVLRKLGHPK